MLKHQVSELRRLNISNQNNHGELKQYRRRLCLRSDGVPTKVNESSDDVLDSVKSLFKETKVDIPESIIDRAHRTGSRYLDASSNNCCKSIIICFTTFHHRTMFYRAKNKLKRGVRIKLDLTKSRYNLLKRANDHVKEVPQQTFQRCFNVVFRLIRRRDVGQRQINVETMLCISTLEFTTSNNVESTMFISPMT